MMETEETCQNCKWWHRCGAKYPENTPLWSKIGDCKKHPNYIRRHEEDWCGEFEAKPQSEL